VDIVVADWSSAVSTPPATYKATGASDDLAELQDAFIREEFADA